MITLITLYIHSYDNPDNPMQDCNDAVKANEGMARTTVLLAGNPNISSISNDLNIILVTLITLILMITLSRWGKHRDICSERSRGSGHEEP